MKKVEAEKIAPMRAQVLIEYINQILSDTQKVSGKILINSAKIDGEWMCTFDISVPIRNFEKHLNSGIPSQHCDVLNEQILQKLIENFMDSETMGVTKYYCIRGGYGMNMNGVDAINSIGSSIKINFIC